MPTTKKVAKKTKKTKKIVEPKSFMVAKEQSPFLSFKITRQTFYWLILLILIFILGLWVLNIQIQTTDILNSMSV